MSDETRRHPWDCSHLRRGDYVSAEFLREQFISRFPEIDPDEDPSKYRFFIMEEAARIRETLAEKGDGWIRITEKAGSLRLMTHQEQFSEFKRDRAILRRKQARTIQYYAAVDDDALSSEQRAERRENLLKERWLLQMMRKPGLPEPPKPKELGDGED